MYATVVESGRRIEVLAFVYVDRALQVVWRDDDGWLVMLPASDIRMEPHTQVDHCHGCDGWDAEP